MMTTLDYPYDRAAVSLHTEMQAKFSSQLMDLKEEKNFDWRNLKQLGNTDYSFPAKIRFEWTSDQDKSVFKLSTDRIFTQINQIETTDNFLVVGNLLLGKTYYWQVNDSEVFSFITEEVPPRWIYAEGLTNIRDMGGWKTAEGKRIKQGLLFRGSEMDAHLSITPCGIHALRMELNIRADLDLRGEAVGVIAQSPLGSDIKFLHIPVEAYDEFLVDKKTAKLIFEAFSDESNFPMYFHCWGGADRTGTIAFLLEAFLGVCDEDILRDYELTSLSIWGDRRRNQESFGRFIAELDAYGNKEDTYHTKTLNFLKVCNIAGDILEKIKRIFLEEDSCDYVRKTRKR